MVKIIVKEGINILIPYSSVSSIIIKNNIIFINFSNKIIFNMFIHINFINIEDKDVFYTFNKIINKLQFNAFIEIYVTEIKNSICNIDIEKIKEIEKQKEVLKNPLEF